MVAPKSCTYSPSRPLSERAEAFVYHGGCHFGVASCAAVFFLYLLEVENPLPGALIGGGAAVAVNLTHLLVHLETHYREGLKESCRLPYGGELLLGAFLTYHLSKGLLYAFGYQMGRGGLICLGGISMLSIAAYNQTEKE